MLTRWCVLVALCVSVIACDPGEDPEPEAAPAVDAETMDTYATAAQEACDDYLGGLFELAQEDEQLDTQAEDASQELFLRRGHDIADRYDQYRSRMAAIDPPDDEDVQSAHDEALEMMDENVKTMRAMADAYEAGDRQEAEALMENSSRLEDEIGVLQAQHGLRPCG